MRADETNTAFEIQQRLKLFLRSSRQTEEKSDESLYKKMGLSRHQYFQALGDEPCPIAKSYLTLKKIAQSRNIDVNVFVNILEGKAAEDGSLPPDANAPSNDHEIRQPEFIIINDDQTKLFFWIQKLRKDSQYIRTFALPNQLLDSVNQNKVSLEKTRLLILDRYFFGKDLHGSVEFQSLIRICRDRHIPVVLATASYVQQVRFEKKSFWRKAMRTYDLITDSRPKRADSLFEAINAAKKYTNF